MKKIASIFALLIAALIQLNAQNPYAALGIEEKVLHYDDGHKEMFDLDSVKAIGYAVYSPETGLLTLYDLKDSLVAVQKIDPAKMARFLSVDPITSQYPELTPYQFASNTPIMAIDLDGLEKEEVVQAFGWAGDQVAKLTVEVAGGVYGLFTNPRQAVSNIWGSLKQTSADVGTIFGTAGSIVYNQVSGTQNINGYDEFHEAIHRQTVGLIKSATFSAASGAAVSTVKNVAKIAKKTSNAAQTTTPRPKDFSNHGGEFIDDGARIGATEATKGGGPIVGGGAKLEYLGSNVNRIQSIATKYNLEVSVVGSRAKGTANALSDWDYIITGGTSKTRSSALFQLPRNLNAVKDGMYRPGSEMLKGVTVDPNLPHIIFKPQN